tara:strand:+ start:79 stop:435 length:357 start_codon:yes stop_codon:yes gene_type:complete
MSMKTVVSLIIIVALGSMGYFQIEEQLNRHQTALEIMDKDLLLNTDFRIKWPRGLLGSLPADAEQFMLLEHIAGEIEKLNAQIATGLHNEVNISRLKLDMTKVLDDIEKLKDRNRERP